MNRFLWDVTPFFFLGSVGARHLGIASPAGLCIMTNPTLFLRFSPATVLSNGKQRSVSYLAENDKTSAWRGSGDDWILRALAIGEKLCLFFAHYFQFRSVGFPPQGLGVKDTNESIGKSSHATSGADAVQRRGSGGEVEGGNDDGLVNGWSIFGA